MAAGMERYPSDVLVTVEAVDVLVRESSLDSLFMEFSLQRDVSLDSLSRNDSINPDVDLGLASGFLEGGNYVVTRDSRAFANPSVGDIAISTIAVAEMVPEEDGEARLDGAVVRLDDGDFAKDAVSPVISTDEHGEAGDLSSMHFAGTSDEIEVDPILDTPVSDTISGVPTFEHSHDVVRHLERAGIIPKVLDRFTPTTTVRVMYDNNVEIQNGMKVMAGDMLKPPRVEIEGAFVMPGSLYTIMFIAQKEKVGEHLHWMHVNYQGPQSITSAVARAGADVVHYEAPKVANSASLPPLVSYLAFLLFRQTERLITPVAQAQDEVSARGFAAAHHLTPVGALCFEVV